MSTPAVDDDYVVKLPSGNARVMSIEELDAALEAGKIHKDTPVLAPGTVTWTTLGVLAGLDDDTTPGAVPSEVAPSIAPSTPPSSSPLSIAPMMMSGRDFGADLALDDDDGAALTPRRGAAKVVGIVFGAIAVLAVGFAIKSAVSQSIATSAGEAALASMPPSPPPPAAMPLPSTPPPAFVAPTPPTPAPAPPPVAAQAPATSKVTASNASKDDKKRKLPGAPVPKKKK